MLFRAVLMAEHRTLVQPMDHGQFPIILPMGLQQSGSLVVLKVAGAVSATNWHSQVDRHLEKHSLCKLPTPEETWVAIISTSLSPVVASVNSMAALVSMEIGMEELNTEVFPPRVSAPIFQASYKQGAIGDSTGLPVATIQASTGPLYNARKLSPISLVVCGMIKTVSQRSPSNRRPYLHHHLFWTTNLATRCLFLGNAEE